MFQEKKEDMPINDLSIGGMASLVSGAAPLLKGSR
jgi:hypothetical protein